MKFIQMPLLLCCLICMFGCSQTPSKPTPNENFAAKESAPKIGEDETDEIIFPPRKPKPPPSLPYSSPIEIVPDKKSLDLPFPTDNPSLSDDKAKEQKTGQKQKKSIKK